MSEVLELAPRVIKAQNGLNKKGLTPKQNRERKTLKREVKAFAVANDLDWGVFKRPFHIEINDEMVETDNFGLVHSKSGEVLNSVKSGYRVSQNLHIIQLMLKGVKPFGDKLDVVKAGALNGGRKVFIQLRIIGDGFVKGDRIERYVTIIDSNDGTASLSVGIGNLTVSCMNQFFYFYKNGDAKFRHSASMAEKMKEIPTLIEMALSRSMRMQNLYEEFESTPCTRELAHTMVRKQLGISLLSTKEDLEEISSRKKNQMESLYKNIYGEMDGDEGNNNVGKGENLWGLFSGVTRWTTHDKSAPRRPNGRIEGVMVGTNYKTNLKALEMVLEESELSF